jgi:hypothetical protein
MASESTVSGTHIRTVEDESGATLLNIETGRLYRFNRAAAGMWKALMNGEAPADIARRLSARPGADPSEAEAAVRAFVAGLARVGAIKVAARPSMWRAGYLAFVAVCELLRYDVTAAVFGFRRIHSSLSKEGLGGHRARPCVDEFAKAMAWATTLYWKPVRCLQRSVAMARLLRRRGVAARVVIGCRDAPFYCHAWVEVNSQIIAEAQPYGKRFQVLETM